MTAHPHTGLLRSPLMPRPLALGVRQAVRRAAVQGTSAGAIARQFGLRASTVRQLLRRFRARGPAGLRTDYGACGQGQARPDDPLRQAALQLRADHPRWGAGRLRVQLRRLFPARPLPCERTLQRWLRPLGQPPAPAGRPPAVTARARQPHAVWQVDAVEQQRLATGQLISWLRVADECSGAVLRTVVFPPRPFQPGAPGGGATALAGLLCGLGPAGGPEGGQRLAVGVVERPAAAAGPVADRAGAGDDLEPAAPAPAQRGGREQPRGRAALGRAGAL